MQVFVARRAVDGFADLFRDARLPRGIRANVRFHQIHDDALRILLFQKRDLRFDILLFGAIEFNPRNLRKEFVIPERAAPDHNAVRARFLEAFQHIVHRDGRPLLVLALLALLKALLKINTQKSIGNFVNLIAISEMRKETLGDIADQKLYGKNEIEFMEMLRGKRNPENTKIEIPYEILGFYMMPVKKQTMKEKTFLISSLILGTLITFFTLVWGMI